MWRMCSFRRVERSSCFRFARYISASNVLSKSHYDVLGITPKATQNDVKTAYYKLSMMYHPDKNIDEDTSSAFKDITAAYEVLGNYKLRKLYDRGLLHTAGADQDTHVHENPQEKFYQSRAYRHSASSSSERPPIYDFDEWARQHYGNSFAKRVEAKARWESSQKIKLSDKSAAQSEILMFMVFTFVASFVLASDIFSDSYDVDHTQDVASEKNVNSIEL